ncbi:MAG: NADH-quinone oxidoreductase subunit C [Promicromonosporaceae bacterium]|nr:NADH-quinone oxidoreductase subunit C [Promicromonosporaceae bacterium]
MTNVTTGFGGLVPRAPQAGSEQRPLGGWFDAVVDRLSASLAAAGVDPAAALPHVVVERGTSASPELTLRVAPTHLLAVCQALRDEPDLRFDLSLGVSGVHYPADIGGELHAVYHLTSVTHGRRLRLEVAVPAADPRLPSTTGIYPANNWHEREAFDFFGLVFEGHPSLARIAMPDDWPGHPQRKDYPLGGIPVTFHGAQVPPPEARRQT